MKNYNIPMLDTEENITFPGIPEQMFDSVMDKIGNDFQQQIIENAIQESQSIEFASSFIATSGDILPRLKRRGLLVVR